MTAAVTSCTARPVAARPRSTSRPAPRRSSVASERSCSCPRSRSLRRPSAASRRASAARIALLHSGLTEAERRDERERIASGDARVVVGARSAVFAPVRGLGLICVDEEHDASYKQESDPRYDARTVAAKRASLEGAVGRLRERDAEARELGGARAARARRPAGRASCRRCASSTCGASAGYPLSAPLLAELGRIAEHGGKAILLLNRRGLVPAIHCRDVRRHAPLPELRRRACPPRRRRSALPPLRPRRAARRELCPECGSAELARLGAGTQRLERELAARLPELELIRLDADSPRPVGGAANGSPRRTGRCCSARRWSRRATISKASRSPRWSTRTRASRFPTSAPRSVRSSCSPSSRAAAAATRRAAS